MTTSWKEAERRERVEDSIKVRLERLCGGEVEGVFKYNKSNWYQTAAPTHMTNSNYLLNVNASINYFRDQGNERKTGRSTRHVKPMDVYKYFN